jgi:hypothetical protein
MLGVFVLALMLPAFIYHRGNTAYGRGEWVFDGFVWNGRQDAWFSGTFCIKIDPKARADSQNTRLVQDISSPLNLPAQMLPSKCLDLEIAVAVELMTCSFRVRDHEVTLRNLPYLYILGDSSLYQHKAPWLPKRPAAALLEQLRQIGNALALSTPQRTPPPASVKLLVKPPRAGVSTSDYDTGVRLALGGVVGAAVGEAMDARKAKECDDGELSGGVKGDRQ